MLPDDPQRDVDFWNLWENNKELFFRKCLKLMNGDVFEAEDALSAAMLKAREKMILYRDRIYNFKGWALRLTENVCLDQLRKHRRLISYDEFPESLVPKEVDHSHISMESTENYYSREAVLNGIFEFVCELPSRLREPALLRFLFSAPYRDIAGRLHITEENARKRIQKARSVLRIQYGEKITGLFSSSEEIKIAPDSPVMKKFRQDASSILDSVESELELCWKTAWVINTLPITGTDREVLIFLPLKPGWHGKGFASFLDYISRHPGGWKRHLELAQMLYAIGIWDQAEKEFRHILKKRSRSFPTLMLLGNMLMESGRGDEAAGIFQEACSLAYRDSSRHYLSGMAAMSRAQPRDAIVSFEKANVLEPANVTFSHAKGVCLFRSGKYSEALRFFRDILAGRPGDVVSLAYCCEVSIYLNRPKQAGEYADRILANNPLDFFALKRKSTLAGLKCTSRTEELKRLQRLSSRLAQLARIVKEPENDKFTDCTPQTFIYRKTDRKGGEHMDHGKGGCPEPNTDRPPAPWS